MTIYADPSGAQASRNACTIGGAERLKGRVPNARKRTKATNIQCRFGQRMRLSFTQLRNGIKISALRRNGTKVLEMKLLGADSSVIYDKERCERKPPPV